MLKNKKNVVAIVISIAYLIVTFINTTNPVNKFLSPIASDKYLESLKDVKNTGEVFGFAPYWNFDKLDNINFDTLTTLAYFDIKVDSQGNLITNDPGYETFTSRQATKLFQKAHAHGTRVVITLTQMDPYEILAILDDKSAQDNLIDQAVTLVQKRGLDGINLDFEYGSDAGQDYTDKFSHFTSNLTKAMHKAVPSSKVTVSTYASAVKEHKIYDIKSLAQNSDGIFMMAYDFAIGNSDTAMPTSPLYGHKEGKYWYDVSTAVNDFLTEMPSNKLILGIPWYGYNYAVYEPKTNSQTLWSGGGSQTYASVINDGSDKNGWDDAGKVGWRASYDSYAGVWRMVFVEDQRSLKIKYDFAQNKQLAGIGIWALGNDAGKRELWDQLKANFGGKLVRDYNIVNKVINDNI